MTTLEELAIKYFEVMKEAEKAFSELYENNQEDTRLDYILSGLDEVTFQIDKIIKNEP